LSAKSWWSVRPIRPGERADQLRNAGQDDDKNIDAAHSRHRPKGQAEVHGQGRLNSGSPRFGGTTCDRRSAPPQQVGTSWAKLPDPLPQFRSGTRGPSESAEHSHSGTRPLRTHLETVGVDRPDLQRPIRQGRTGLVDRITRMRRPLLASNRFPSLQVL
jgi:hypothetical protein